MLRAIPLISNHFLVADAFFVVVELPLFLFEDLALLAVFSLAFLSELESATFFQWFITNFLQFLCFKTAICTLVFVK